MISLRVLSLRPLLSVRRIGDDVTENIYATSDFLPNLSPDRLLALFCGWQKLYFANRGMTRSQELPTRGAEVLQCAVALVLSAAILDDHVFVAPPLLLLA